MARGKACCWPTIAHVSGKCLMLGISLLGRIKLRQEGRPKDSYFSPLYISNTKPLLPSLPHTSSQTDHHQNTQRESKQILIIQVQNLLVTTLFQEQVLKKNLEVSLSGLWLITIA